MRDLQIWQNNASETVDIHTCTRIDYEENASVILEGKGPINGGPTLSDTNIETFFKRYPRLL